MFRAIRLSRASCVQGAFGQKRPMLSQREVPLQTHLQWRKSHGVMVDSCEAYFLGIICKDFLNLWLLME